MKKRWDLCYKLVKKKYFENSEIFKNTKLDFGPIHESIAEVSEKQLRPELTGNA
jgi:hypothetical protein